MRITNNIREKSISLKAAHTLMIVVTVIIAVLLVLGTVLTSFSYRELSEAADDFIELQKNANQLMEASDYLTEQVQNYTVTCQRSDLDNYFTEAEVDNRREKALEKVAAISGESEAYQQLKMAMDTSVELMQTEYYAIRLVLEATGDTDYPEAVAAVTLTPEDAALTPEQKLSAARETVFGAEYDRMKGTIRLDMKNCLDRLEAQVRIEQLDSDRKVSRHAMWLMVLIGFETAAVIAVLWMTSRLGISPILRGVRSIKADSPLEVSGSKEFRYLAEAYNKMYDAFKKDIANLNYDASHDKLTGIYNRTGYEFVRNNIDISTTALLLIDADNFKTINDTHGHTVGDCVLKKIANTLNRAFRSDDFVCRIGGDEFAVFMMHATPELQDLIDNKVSMINRQLSDPTKDSFPPISISVGVAFGAKETDISVMTKHADEALYVAKERGRCGCSFY
ncbi:MAG: GGDEF domain-containing protein [Ruminococcus sp.]|nr:GGDEF domain-containing protein [Ruminococcus sp.]